VTGSPVVSVVIPCYNAEPWIAEALESCQRQTYPCVEIIVVDDGSTDGSLALIESYGNEIQSETGPNLGGNHARNRGFQRSVGDYIQFLDADDYLLPEKIERQVAFLEETGADVVYGDWRHRFHEPDGSSHLGEVHISGKQKDVLESLLAGWWVAPAALLWRRKTVAHCGGWDEKLAAAQDRDFFTAAALRGADVRYQPGCFSVYRRYGNVTVSTFSRARWLENHQLVLEKAEASLVRAGQLIPRYRCALAKSYFSLARNYYDLDRSIYCRLLQKVLSLCPGFEPDESRLYNTVWRLKGFTTAERLASYKRRMFRGGTAKG
jgi:glycosyltransferase involved in cell wall biosynthesis